jgi:tetratricopeptide (TPR) repeat protein
MKFDTTALDLAFPPEHLRAIEWATHRHETSRVDLVDANNWASTYRLSGPSGNAFLKLVPDAQREQLGRALRVTETFPDRAPAVLAFDLAAGSLLTADHRGREPWVDASGDERPGILRRYGRIQAGAARMPGLLAQLEEVDPRMAHEELLAFLERPWTAGSGAAAPVGAAYFIGEDQASLHLRLLRSRGHLLAPLLERAAALPHTVCHGDFQLRNIAIRGDGEPVFFDWDDVSAGPAGLCLHGLLGGCALPAVALEQIAANPGAARSPQAIALKSYIRALVAGRYATRRQLLSGLAGAIAAGAMRFIATFAKFPGESSRADSGRTILRKLGELLDLCDWLVCRDSAAALASADEYERYGDWHRAQRLVQDQLARQEPQSLDLLLRYATLSHRAGDSAAAEEAFREAAGRAPGRSEPRVGLARVLMERLALDESAGFAEEALALDAASREARAIRTRVRQLRKLREVSESPRGWPRVAVSAEERANRRLSRETRAIVLELFRRQGAVQLDGVFSPEQIARLQGHYYRQYQEHFHDGRHPDALQVGDKRYMLTVELDEEFGSAELIASGLLMPVMRKLLGDELILSAYTSVASLPGSTDQNIHRDHTGLFDQENPDLVYPAFAVQVILPLVPLDEYTGATRMFKGTQRVPIQEAVKRPHQDPVVPLGSCLLNDYLCPHYGRGNRSDRVRPILTYIYTRPWFRDYLNYHFQTPLRFAPGFLASAPDAVRELVGWCERERRLASAPSPVRAAAQAVD